MRMGLDCDFDRGKTRRQKNVGQKNRRRRALSWAAQSLSYFSARHFSACALYFARPTDILLQNPKSLLSLSDRLGYLGVATFVSEFNIIISKSSANTAVGPRFQERQGHIKMAARCCK